MDKLWIWIAVGFGSGRMKKLPGTWGTIVAMPLAYGLAQLPPLWVMGFTFLSVLGAIEIANFYESRFAGHDRSEVVIDEIVGYFIAVMWLPLTWQSLFFGFFIFRFFDILKPFPISWVDRRVEGGLGVVADDVVAGIFTNILLQFAYSQTNWLGYQL